MIVAYIEESKKRFGKEEGTPVTHENLMLGCAQRSAAALEAIAKPYNELLQKVEYQKSHIESLEARNKRLNLSNIALRAWITRLKNNLARQVLQG
jgi:hypothetical protein